MYHPASEDIREEYIELVHTGSETADLSQWRLTDGVDFTFPAILLQPSARLVIAADLAVFTNLYPGVTNVIGNWVGQLSNSGEDIELRDTLTNLVDRVRYADEGDWATRERGQLDYGHRGWVWRASHDGEGASLELIQSGLSNDFGQNWAGSPAVGGSPGNANGAAAVDLAPVITDVQHLPAVPTSSEPLVVTARIVDELDTGLIVRVAYRLDGTEPFTFLPMADDGLANDGTAGDGTYGAVLPAQADQTIVEWYVEAEDAGSRRRTWPAPTGDPGRLLGHWSLDDGSGDTAVDTSGRDQHGDLVNNPAWIATPAGHLAGALQLDGSSQYVQLESNLSSEPPLGVQTFTIAAWFRRDGTGVEAVTGGVQGFDAEPLVTKGRSEAEGDEKDLNWFLGLVQDGSDLVIAADFEEHSSGSSPGLNHPILGRTPIVDGQWYHAVATYDGAAFVLYLDGVEDASLSVNAPPNFECIQPAAIGTALNSSEAPAGYFHGAIDEVWVADVALDDSGAQALYTANTFSLPPLEGEQNANLLYQVDDTSYGPTQALYRLVMKEIDRAELDAIGNSSDEGRSHAQMNGTFFYTDGVNPAVRYTVGIRNRGNGSRTATPNNRRVNFRSDRTWSGLNALSFNSVNTHIQAMGSVLFQRAGLVTAKIRPVRVIENGQDLSRSDDQMFGHYARLEVLNSDFTDAHYPDDSAGNAYQARRIWPEVIPSDLGYLGPDPDPYRPLYEKKTNASEDDFTDLIDLTYVLSTNTPDHLFADELARVLNADQWMRFLALQTLVDNDETNISNGVGDDFNLYRGILDARFELIPHDLDTVLGQSDSSTNAGLFRFLDLPPVERLFKEPSVAPWYYHHLLELSDTVYAEDAFDPLVDRVLGAIVPASKVNEIKQFARDRIAYVGDRIPQELTVTTTLSVVDGLPQSSTGTADLSGQTHAARTRTVRVNGQTAAWSAWEAAWSLSGVALWPGDNRILVEALDEHGAVFDTAHIDIRYERGAVTAVGGTLSTSTVWTVAQGPYRMVTDLVIPAGLALDIEPGTTVYVEDGLSFDVRGTLRAIGSEIARIRFTPPPDTPGSWGGFRFIDGPGTNKLVAVDLDNASSGTEAIYVSNTSLLLDRVTWSGIDHTLLELDHASVVVRNSTFPGIDNSEAIHGTGIPNWGQLVIESNVFNIATGASDIIHFTGGLRPGPILQVRYNQFLGGSDDGLELAGADAHIEGNVFEHFHQDHPGASTANAIATGTSSGESSSLMVARNIFYNNDHALLLAEQAEVVSHNNTYVNSRFAAVQFDEPGLAAQPGLGGVFDGDLFVDCAVVFTNVYVGDPVKGTTVLTVDHSTVPEPWTGWGTGNDGEDPRFLDPTGDFRLGPGSPAIGTGPNGLDRGAHVAAGVSLAGEPATPTFLATASLSVAGPGITHYRARLNEGPLGPETDVGVPIDLTGLAAGSYTVYAVGVDSAGVWQPETYLTGSRTWTVDPAGGGLRINELMADNRSAIEHLGVYPDMVELHHTGAGTFDLGDMSLTDRLDDPRRFVVPHGTSLVSGEYLVLYADTNRAPQELHMDFSFRSGGETLYLYDAPARGGGLVDTVTFGPQAADLSIGRDGLGEWTLCTPTFGNANQPTRTGDPAALRINEWLTNIDSRFIADFVELYNGDSLPVDLGGIFLTDDPGRQPDRHPIIPLSYIAAGGRTTFLADNDPEEGGDHLDFRLGSEAGWIGLFDRDLTEIDVVYYGPQIPDVSEGRSPDGGDRYRFFERPTPGLGNPGAFGLDAVTTTLLTYTNTWRFHQDGTLPAVDWVDPTYDDSAWPEGAGLLYVENSDLPEPKSTPLTLGEITYYFRTEFVADVDLGPVSLALTTVIDDGAIVYLNGSEVLRIGIDPGDITPTDLSDRTVGNAYYEGPMDVPADALITGTNVLAVEVHQSDPDSSDIVLGMHLEQTTTLYQEVVLNEVLARNDTQPEPGGSYPDWVELFNPSMAPIDLAGLSLSDDYGLPGKWRFPEGAMIPAGGYFIVLCDSAAPVSVTNTGFGFDWEGDSVFLFDVEERGSGLLDSVTFGIQVPDMSLGRMPNGAGDWVLTNPTREAENQVAALGDPARIRINEWMADPSSGEDWFELYQPDPLPVDVAGLSLTDDLLNRFQYRLPPRSYLPPATNQFIKFVADKNLELGAHHVNFKLSRKGDHLGLFTPTGVQIDAVSFGLQTLDASQGRLPNGTEFIVSFPSTPSPGWANYALDTDGDGLPDPWEDRFGDALLDTDGDGLNTGEEFTAGTDPADPESHLQVLDVQHVYPTWQVWFPGVIGKTYRLQGTTDPESGTWETVQSLGPQAETGEVRVDVMPNGDPSHLIFRMVTP